MPPPKAIAKANPKIAGPRSAGDRGQQKMEQAKASGAPTKNLEDRVYEIEDASGLSTAGAEEAVISYTRAILLNERRGYSAKMRRGSWR